MGEHRLNKARTIRVVAFTLSLLGTSLTTLAQDEEEAADVLEVAPVVGTWVIDEENNGKPGRGFQIDVQNDVLVLYFYGYERTGESTYWLAAGKLPQGSNELTADLGEYQGGMAFGDAKRNANYLGSRGQMTIRFTSHTKGEICLPQELCKAISAFNFGYEKSASELLGVWIVHFVNSYGEMSLRRFEFQKVIAPANSQFVDGVVGDEIDSEEGNERKVLDGIRCFRSAITSPEIYTYTCRSVHPWPSQYQDKDTQIGFNRQRNAFVGRFNDPARGVGQLVGFRTLSSSGRLYLPN